VLPESAARIDAICSEVTFLCGPGGFISGGVTKAVVDCIVNKNDLAGVFKTIIPMGVVTSIEDYTAVYNADKIVPAKAKK
jgi:hypothetical protein